MNGISFSDCVALVAAAPISGGEAAGQFSVETLIWLLVYLFVALVFSFLCSVAEAVLLSVNRAYIDTLKAHGSKAGEILERFKAKPDEPLSAILTLNTVAHTVGAAGVGYEAAELFGQKWLGVSSFVMTLLILIGSEIIPKTIGATHWRKLAPITTQGIRFLVWVLKPFIRILQHFTEGLAGHGGANDQSRAEIESIISRASQSGTLSEEESNVLRNLFELRRIPVKEIMTPRVVVFSLPLSTSVETYRMEYVGNGFARIPVYGAQPDEVCGFVLRADLLAAANTEVTLEVFRRDLPVVTESLPVSALYTELIGGREHIALVVNEYGDYTGIATLEDVIETLLGTEIVDELDNATDMRRVAMIQARRARREAASESNSVSEGAS
ncbi:MAG: HlyC/CorC family transporter [Verrucomicrobiae bacterium]|nr:HlyC/CorC family transporter [Verrucomicrobiae bacterium]